MRSWRSACFKADWRGMARAGRKTLTANILGRLVNYRRNFALFSTRVVRLNRRTRWMTSPPETVTNPLGRIYSRRQSAGACRRVAGMFSTLVRMAGRVNTKAFYFFAAWSGGRQKVGFIPAGSAPVLEGGPLLITPKGWRALIAEYSRYKLPPPAKCRDLTLSLSRSKRPCLSKSLFKENSIFYLRI